MTDKIARELEWEQQSLVSTWYAESVIGQYAVWEGYYRPPNAYGGIAAGSTVKDAKAGAQKHLEATLRSALSPALLSSIEGKEPAAYAENDGDQWYIYWPNTTGTYEHIRDYPHLHEGITKLYASPAPPVEGTADKTPAVKLAEWAQEGPRLAKAAGCYVGIRITDASAALTAIGARDAD